MLSFAQRDGALQASILSSLGPDGPICRSGLLVLIGLSLFFTFGPFNRRASFLEFILVGPCSSVYVCLLWESLIGT